MKLIEVDDGNYKVICELRKKLGLKDNGMVIDCLLKLPEETFSQYLHSYEVNK